VARCPFATWRPISGSSGSHVGGPFKVVHHTTEGSTAEGAMNAFRTNRSDPHFTVDATRIFQHIDTAEGARALRNDPGGVQTNRDSAVQIELVGFAHLPKDRRALTNLARLCRGVLHFGVLTQEDWDRYCDRSTTDRNVHLRPGAWYRERLGRGFLNAGCGMFVRRGAPVHLWELERPDPARSGRRG